MKKQKIEVDKGEKRKMTIGGLQMCGYIFSFHACVFRFVQIS